MKNLTPETGPSDREIDIEALKYRFHSSAWKNFIASYFGDPYLMWHDGPDPSAIDRLTVEEKAVAEEMLLASVGGMWSADGLEKLGSKRGITAMEAALAKETHDPSRIRLADAIMHLTHDGTHLPILLKCLRASKTEDGRLEAAMYLGKYPNPEVVEALFAAVLDPSYLVRYHACNSLLEIHGLPVDISSQDAIFKNILKDTSPAQHQKARQLLQELCKNKQLPKKRKKSKPIKRK